MAELDPPHEQIRTLVWRHFTLVDAREDAAAVADLYHEDTAVVPATATSRGRAEIAAYYQLVFDTTRFLRHHTMNNSIELTDTTHAIHRCYFVAVVARPKRASVMMGNYADRVELRDGRWLFAEKTSEAVLEIPIDAALLGLDH